MNDQSRVRVATDPAPPVRLMRSTVRICLGISPTDRTRPHGCASSQSSPDRGCLLAPSDMPQIGRAEDTILQLTPAMPHPSGSVGAANRIPLPSWVQYRLVVQTESISRSGVSRRPSRRLTEERRRRLAPPQPFNLHVGLSSGITPNNLYDTSRSARTADFYDARVWFSVFDQAFPRTFLVGRFDPLRFPHDLSLPLDKDT